MIKVQIPAKSFLRDEGTKAQRDEDYMQRLYDDPIIYVETLHATSSRHFDGGASLKKCWRRLSRSIKRRSQQKT